MPCRRNDARRKSQGGFHCSTQDGVIMALSGGLLAAACNAQSAASANTRRADRETGEAVLRRQKWVLLQFSNENGVRIPQWGCWHGRRQVCTCLHMRKGPSERLTSSSWRKRRKAWTSKSHCQVRRPGLPLQAVGLRGFCHFQPTSNPRPLLDPAVLPASSPTSAAGAPSRSLAASPLVQGASYLQRDLTTAPTAEHRHNFRARVTRYLIPYTISDCVSFLSSGHLRIRSTAPLYPYRPRSSHLPDMPPRLGLGVSITPARPAPSRAGALT